MGYQVNSSVNVSKAGMEAGYNNYNAQGVRSDSFVGNNNSMPQNGINQVPVGSTFRGEVVDVTNDKVTIRMESGQMVQARMAEQMNFNIGDKVLFQVKSHGDGVIEIKPIAATLQGQEMTILKALEAAKLPVTEKTVIMVQQLLNEQMPIDKNSLQDMYKQMISNKGIDIQTLVQMKKLQIPITKENVGQFEAYKNYEHRISAEVWNFSEQLTEVLKDTMSQNPAVGKQLHMDILSMLLGKGIKGEPVTGNGTNNVTGQLLEGGITGEFNGLDAKGNITGDRNNIVNSYGNGMTNDVSDINNGMNPVSGTNHLVGELSGSEGKLPDIFFGKQEPAAPEYIKGQIGIELSAGERQELVQSLRGLSVPDEMVQQILDGTADAQNVFKTIASQITQLGESGELSQLLQSSGYEKLLKSQIRGQWFLDPNQELTKEKLDEFYENLSKQSRQVEQMLNAANLSQSTAAKTVGGIKDNIDFMNQINQMFTYVQLPFLMEGKAMHSDLYVFTRKKSLRDETGKLSALLHLDSETLGALDIYVEMDGTQVDTQFKLETEQLVEMFQTNMPRLSSAIEEKGYQFRYDVATREKQVDFVEDFLARDHGNTPMQRFAFDVRA